MVVEGDTGKSEKAAQEEIEKLNVALEKERQRVANAEEKINAWGNEVGELRKDRDSLKTTLKDAQDLIENLKKNVDSNDSTRKIVKGDITEEKPDEVANTVEKSLNDGQRKAGELAFSALNDAEKIQYENDAKFRLSFLTRLQEVAPVVPSSPWKTAPKKKDNETSGYQSILDRVFTKKKQASYVPSGSQSGSPVLGAIKDDSFEPPEDSRVH